MPPIEFFVFISVVFGAGLFMILRNGGFARRRRGSGSGGVPDGGGYPDVGDGFGGGDGGGDGGGGD